MGALRLKKWPAGRARGGERESHGARAAAARHVVDGARRRRGCDNRAALAKDEQRAL